MYCSTCSMHMHVHIYPSDSTCFQYSYAYGLYAARFCSCGLRLRRWFVVTVSPLPAVTGIRVDHHPFTADHTGGRPNESRSWQGAVCPIEIGILAFAAMHQSVP